MASRIRQILPIQQHSPFDAPVTAVMKMLLFTYANDILIPGPLGCNAISHSEQSCCARHDERL